MKNNTCENCNKDLIGLNPPIEEYLEHKFIIKIPFTNWKFCLIKDNIELGCPDCLAEQQQERRHDNDEKIYYEGMEAGYIKAMEER